jgi:hypothetical protein
VKRLGTPRNVDEQEAVWAGRPVNYAAKAAQSADRHEVVVTGSIWDHFEKNDYVAFSCGCDGLSSPALWQDHTIANLHDNEQYGRILKVPWCVNCGPSFCEAIRTGQTKRDDIPDSARMKLTMSAMRTAVARKAVEDRARQRALRRLR